MLYELTTVPIHQTATTNCISPVQQKDYSRPLHVDCSVEYELPSQVKPPPSTNGKIDPLLMIHPCYFRKIEAQRRSPFINNLPGRGVSTAVSSNSTSSSTVNISNQIVSNRCTANRIVSGQTNSTSTNPQQQQQQHTTGSVCHSRSVKTQQQQSYQQATIPHYHMPNNVRHQQHGWPTDHQHQQQPANPHIYSKQATTLSAAVGTLTKHPSHHHHHQLPNCGGVAGSNDLYNTSATLEGGLWTNTNHSPLVAERFPEPQVTLHQIQPTITATDNNTVTAATTTSCSKILATGKYRQYLRTHRLHPYMSMATSAFPQFTQMQQISCYNV